MQMFESQYHEYLIYDTDGSMIVPLIQYKGVEMRICGKHDIKLWYVCVALSHQNHFNKFWLNWEKCMMHNVE